MNDLQKLAGLYADDRKEICILKNNVQVIFRAPTNKDYSDVVNLYKSQENGDQTKFQEALLKYTSKLTGFPVENIMKLDGEVQEELQAFALAMIKSDDKKKMGILMASQMTESQAKRMMGHTDQTYINLNQLQSSTALTN